MAKLKDKFSNIWRCIYKEKNKNFYKKKYFFGIRFSSKFNIEEYVKKALQQNSPDKILSYEISLLERIQQQLDSLEQSENSLQDDKSYFDHCIFFEYKYQNLNFTNTNLGDYVQTIATKNVVNKIFSNINYSYFDRDNLVNYHGKKAFVIMQGWFAHGINFLPINKKLYPIFIGTHITNNYQRDNLLTFLSVNPEYFESKIVGCRDKSTQNFLNTLGIKTYLSRCLTLTLDRRESFPTQNKVFIVDVPKKYLKYIPDELLKNAEFIKQRCIDVNESHTNLFNAREKYMTQTQELLNRYKNEAALIITTALHCASPCTAMGIPVVLFNLEKDNSRFDLLDGIIPYYNKSQIRNRKVNYSPKVPNIEPLKEAMLKNISLTIAHEKGENIDIDELEQVRKFIEEFTVKE